MQTTSHQNNQLKKRRMLIGIGIAVFLGILSGVLLSFPDLFSVPHKMDGPIPTYTGHLPESEFEYPDYDANIFEDASYLELDRRIHLRRGPETVTLESEDAMTAQGEAVILLTRYIESILFGDAQMYNSFFTDTYYKRVLPYERFAPQKIYNILLEEVERTEDIAGDSFVYYVSYAIHENDGTFRRDIPSDAVRTLVFSLVPENGTLKIDAIGY